MLGGPYKRVKEPLGGMIRGALATGGTGGATQPRQEYAAAGQGECKDMGEDRPGTIRKLMPGLSSPISLHSPWPAAAYSSTAHPTPPDRPPYCSLRTGGREGIGGKGYRMALPRDYRNRAILYTFPPSPTY